VAFKSGLTETEAEDVVQETMLSVTKVMPDFEYNPAIGSFRGFLLQITRRRIADQFRKRKREILATDFGSDETTGTRPLERVADLVDSKLMEIWDVEYQRHFLELATERVRRRVNPKHFQLFLLYAKDNWSVEEITKTMEVTAHQVYAANSRISKLIKKELGHLADTR
jgi:RNA polymerase sigma-70 factor (ECF subfamily)